MNKVFPFRVLSIQIGLAWDFPPWLKS